MKHLKKLASLLLAMVMLLGLAATAVLATGEGNPAPEPVEGSLTGGTITITNPVVGQEYSIYQILYLESYNPAEGSEAYSYKANSAWKAWLKESTQQAYVSFNDQDYVTWKEDADVDAFAKLAIAHAKDNNIVPVATKDATAADTSLVFDDLMLGYYLVDSSLGTICSLDTTNPRVDIEEKNEAPSCEKLVYEDSKEAYLPKNDADIGQTVTFRSKITLPKGSENIVFHDTMVKGFTPDKVATDNTQIAVTVYTDEAMSTALDADNYENMPFSTSAETGAISFEIHFKQDYLDGLTADTTILYIKYSAKVNSNAVIGGDGNENTCKVSYGGKDDDKKDETQLSKTRTYVWGFDVLKYANGNMETKLSGAKFVLLKKSTSAGTTTTHVATFDSNLKLTGWVEIPTPDAYGTITWPEGAVLTTDVEGNFGGNGVAGLDGDTYYLREIKAPDGYNILKDDKEFQIAPQGYDGQDASGLSLSLPDTGVIVEVENKSGTELPSTGGIGTTIFYVAGSILLVGAAVLLIVKKRMSVTK